MQTLDSFRLEELFETVPSWLSEAFERMPTDRYIPLGYRSRRLSRFHVNENQIEPLPHAAYVQDGERGYNTLLGNVERWFEEIEPTIVGSVGFRALVLRFIALCGVGGTEISVNVHLIRNACKTGQPGFPAPEGVHRDGFDWVGILCVALHNVIGAETTLYRSTNKDPIFRQSLAPGQLLIVDDAHLLHYTSPIEVSRGSEGFRDVVILTANGGMRS